MISLWIRTEKELGSLGALMIWLTTHGFIHMMIRDTVKSIAWNKGNSTEWNPGKGSITIDKKLRTNEETDI